MINKIGFKNIRVFKELQEFDLNKMTILTGQNNSGKSTIQKMLLLFSNNFKKHGEQFNIEFLDFSKDFEITGDFQSNVNFYTNNDELIFSFAYVDDLWGNLKALLHYEKSKYSQKAVLRKVLIYRSGKEILNLYAEDIIDIIKEDEQYKYLLEDYYFISKNEEKYIWVFKNVKLDIVEILHNLVLKQKNEGNIKKTLHLIDKKLRRKKELSESEKEILNEYKQKGLEFNSNKAKEIIMDQPEHFAFDHWYIYDTQKKNIYGNKNDTLSIKISNIFNTGNDENIIPSNILKNVIEDKIYISNEQVQEELIPVKEKLIKHNILSKEQFYKAYKEFEFKYILWLIKEINIDIDYDYDIGYGYPLERTLFEFANLDMSKHRYSRNAIKGIDKNDVIAELISKELSNLKINLNDYSQTGKGKNKKEEESNPIVDSVIKEISAFILQPIRTLLNDIESFTSNLSLSYYSKIIKRHYLFDDMSISNSPFLEFGIRYINGSKDGKEEMLTFINKWIKEFGFADELIIQTISSEKEIIGISYYLLEGKTKIPLGNSGLGINNLILLLINIQLANNRNSIIALEEPEANLHPAYQSRLVDIISDSYSKFIIETHSEYLVRKLQYFVAKNRFEEKDGVIYYFNNPNNIPKGEDQIREIKINKDGSLSDDFGSGFFDEATNIKFDLLRLKNTENN
jgi:predicted ATPase